MRHLTFTILLLTLFTFKSFSQVDSVSFSELKLQVQGLVTQNNKQTKQLNDIYKDRYVEIQNSVNTALDGANALAFLSINIEILKVVSRAEKTMLSINNISSSESMGFDFKTELINIATEVLVGTIKEGEEQSPSGKRKTRIKSLITSVVNNDLVQGLIKSNPISSMAYSIVNQAFSSSETNFESDAKQVLIKTEFNAPAKWGDFKRSYSSFKGSWNSIGGEFQGITQTQRIILDDKVNEFTQKINNYIQIYDSLNSINENFGFAIKNWENKHDQTVKDASAYRDKLVASFKITSEDENFKLSFDRAKERATSALDSTKSPLKKILENSDLRKSFLISQEFDILKNNTNLAYIDFLGIQIKFMADYIRVLDNTISRSEDKNNDFEVDIENIKKTRATLATDKSDLGGLTDKFKQLSGIN